MGRKTGKKKGTKREGVLEYIHPEIRRSVWVISFIGAAIIFILAAMGQAGPLGEKMFSFLDKIFGVGYYLIPTAAFLMAFSFVDPSRKRVWALMGTGAFVFVFSGLGFIHIISPGSGGVAGNVAGALEGPLGTTASLIVTGMLVIISFLVTLNRPIPISTVIKKFTVPKTKDGDTQIKLREDYEFGDETKINNESTDGDEEPTENDEGRKEAEEVSEEKTETEKAVGGFGISSLFKKGSSVEDENYQLPPLSLLSSVSKKPTIGDLRANANIIKRTLDSFGIPVEMGEVNIGPTVTQYTLKPAEGVKLSRITALNQDLALALAAHPIRIEAPIPGKSFVGIEVPNKAAAIVRLGNLMKGSEFRKTDALGVVLGRDVSGEPVLTDVSKMPHLLVAGATGSGKSITIHSLIVSLLYKNSPKNLRFILIDPKRVELSVYNEIPHLITPVIIENKKALGALKWAVNEMEERYDLLLGAGVRDIKGYNATAEEPMPYLMIIIDELADLMSSFGREVEGAIVRLAQMARATGIHLVVSTQRPSVEVITGLIKANITSRIALQVASQIDSRTILDTSGAEKLLGNGDMLFVSSDSTKPKRVQGAFITEEEVVKVTSFIKKSNKDYGFGEEENEEFFEKENEKRQTIGGGEINFDDFGDEDDELYDEAVKAVREAQRASASLLQRRLRVGYARAARLIDIMEERGVVGPHQGSNARDVYVNDEE